MQGRVIGVRNVPLMLLLLRKCELSSLCFWTPFTALQGCHAVSNKRSKIQVSILNEIEMNKDQLEKKNLVLAN